MAQRFLGDPHSETARLRYAHYTVLRREREDRIRARAAAKEALRTERQRTATDLAEYRRAIDHAKADAQQYQAILAQAKRDGRHLMKVLEWLQKRAA